MIGTGSPIILIGREEIKDLQHILWRKLIQEEKRPVEISRRRRRSIITTLEKKLGRVGKKAEHAAQVRFRDRVQSDTG